MKTPELLEKLSKKYPIGAYSFLSQVRNGTGYTRQARTADAVAMSLWPSRGFDLIGFELKVSRSDWLHELSNPAKAEDIFQYCDEWYLVVADDSIVRDGELPSTWGLMIANGRGGAIQIKKEAPRLKPQPIDKLFLAAIMRNMCEGMVAKDTIQTRIEAAEEQGKRSAETQIKNAQRDFAQLQEIVQRFEKASGVRILNPWQIEEIGHAVKEVVEGRHRQAHKKVEQLKESAVRIVEYLEKEISSYEM